MQFETENAFDIRPLLLKQNGRPEHNLYSDVIEPVFSITQELKNTHLVRQHSSDSETSSVDSLEGDKDRHDEQVRGADIDDLPTQYEVQGLRSNEFPVIGKKTFVYFVVFLKYNARAHTYYFDHRQSVLVK